MTFPCKHDRWITWLLVPALGASILAGFGYPLLLLIVPPADRPDAGLLGLLLTPGIVGMLILWMFLATSYEITEADLIVRFGPLRTRVALDAIDEVIPKKHYAPERSLCLAWSVDRLVIKHRRPDGRPAFFALGISPQEQYGFLQELARRMQERRVAEARVVGVQV
jgi:Bacterial PH domain